VKDFIMSLVQPAHILMPAYNAENYIAASMRSVLSQSYPTTLIVYNDGSTDSTPDIVRQIAREMPERVELVGGPNRGQPYARDRLVEISYRVEPSAPFMWLDSDDTFVDDDSVAKVMERLRETQSEICLFGFDTKWEDPKKAARQAARPTDKIRKREAILDKIADATGGAVSYLSCPDILTTEVTVWSKAFAGHLKTKWPSAAPPIFCEDVPSMAMLLDTYRVSALAHTNPIVSYLLRAGSTMGRRTPKNYTHDIPEQYGCFLGHVDMSNPGKADVASKFVRDRFRIHEKSLSDQIEQRRPGFTPQVMDDYRERYLLFEQKL
jgi:hypothetical protein